MDIYHIIKRPLVTEKGTHQSQQQFDASKSRAARGGAFTFEVHAEATKLRALSNGAMVPCPDARHRRRLAAARRQG